ncbi:MAG: hypothetical protein EPN56_11745 [Rhodanobacter sp.]|nr:MAG: hypothetical protein EPN66_02525 [Rhodanobacter sp.]TAM34849.1 MAG: hypothetical protein EPN56_11745 [Rhodanobacter sp.]
MKFVLFALLLISGVAAAQPAPAAPYTTYGVGNGSCGEWLHDRKSNGWFQTGEWVLGYVSAYGYYGDYQLKHVDSEAMAAWIDNYCQKNPLDSIETATQHLIEALKINKR